MSAKVIENRILYCQREEDRLWRDVQEVRRQASIRDKGKMRTAEKRMSEQAIQEGRELHLEGRRSKANQTKKMLEDSAHKLNEAREGRRQQLEVSSQDQRRMSAEILRQKRLGEKQSALRNTERAVAIQRSQLVARFKTAQQKSERIQALREDAERHRMEKELGVHELESRLSVLEAEELACIERLQNSRVVTQSVFDELETSFGSRASMCSIMRGRPHSPMELLDESLETFEVDETLGAGGIGAGALHDAHP